MYIRFGGESGEAVSRDAAGGRTIGGCSTLLGAAEAAEAALRRSRMPSSYDKK